MSDPVSSMDVEDVLSSIRRLVSEEAKGNGMTNESAADIASEDLHEAAEEAANGPLSDIVQAVEDGSEGGDGGSGGSAYGSVTPPSNEIIEDSGASVDAGDAPADGQVAFRRHKARGAGGKETDQKLVLTAAFRVEEKADTPSDTPSDTGASLDEAGEDAPEETRAYPHLRPVEDAADGSGGGSGGGSAGSGADILRQLAGAPDDTLFDRARQAMEAVRESAPVRQPVAEPPVEPEVAETAAEPIEPTMTAEVSPLRREVAEGAPEGAEAEDAAVDPDPVEPRNANSPASPFNAEGGAFSQPVDAAQDAEASTINFAEEDPSMLDEDSLRDLVSDMVREELQGELGDRITRNVRKLVRREIQRALASREFE
jgi:cell pole-organizing protein PopZ